MVDHHRNSVFFGSPVDGVEFDAGARVYTARADVMVLFGYLPTIRTKCPGEAGYTYTEEWSEENGYIVQNWTAVKLPDSEKELADAVEALETLGYIEESEVNTEVIEEAEM